MFIKDLFFITHEFPCKTTRGHFFSTRGRGHGINFDLSKEIENSSIVNRFLLPRLLPRLIIHTAENTFQPPLLQIWVELRHTCARPAAILICTHPKDPTRVSSCVSTMSTHRHAWNFDIEKNKIEDSSCVMLHILYFFFII